MNFSLNVKILESNDLVSLSSQNLISGFEIVKSSIRGWNVIFEDTNGNKYQLSKYNDKSNIRIFETVESAINLTISIGFNADDISIKSKSKQKLNIKQTE